jgi:ribosomal protein S18 acetylase RimI-like enzyme
MRELQMTRLHPPRTGGFPLTLRAQQHADKGFLQKLYCEDRHDDPVMTGWPAETKEQFLTRQFELQTRSYRATYPAAAFWIVMQSSGVEAPEPIGRLYLDQAPHIWHVIDITISACLCGLGIGSTLLCWVQEAACAAGADVDLNVLVENPAGALYRRLGFLIAEQNELYRYMVWHCNRGLPPNAKVTATHCHKVSTENNMPQVASDQMK